MKFRCFDFEIPQVALDCGFEDLSEDVDPCAFMVNKTLRLGLYINNGEPEVASMKRFTVTVIDGAGQNVYDHRINYPQIDLLETDSENELRRFVSVSAFAHNGAENAMDSGIEPTPDAEMAWDFITLNCEDEDWPKDVPRLTNAKGDGYAIPYFFRAEFERHLKTLTTT